MKISNIKHPDRRAERAKFGFLASFLARASVLLGMLALLTGAILAQRPALPAATGHVNDFAGVVDEATKTKVETMLTNFEKKTGAQIAVVTIQSLEERPIEEYANDLYRAWGIGAKSGAKKDQGALLLIALKDRKTRLEIGYGLEGDLPDGLSGELIRRMRPALQGGDNSQAIYIGTRSIVDTLAEKWQLSLEGIEDRQYAYREKPASKKSNTKLLLVLFVIALIISAIISRFTRGGRGGRGGGGSDLWWLAPIIFNGSGGSFGGGSGDGRGWGGGGGSGGGGSDWGGFGGGSSGGGGASDSW
jgi:uncharacterized protein